jgi:hypothetical protein
MNSSSPLSSPRPSATQPTTFISLEAGLGLGRHLERVSAELGTQDALAVGGSRPAAP